MAANVRASVCGAFRRPSMENRIVFHPEVDNTNELLCVRTCGFGIIMFIFIGCMILFTTWLNTMEGKTSDSLNVPAACIFFLAATFCAFYVVYKECSSVCKKKNTSMLDPSA